MRAVCINGSPKENGCTSHIMNKLIEGMKKSEIEVKIYSLGKMKINYCLGCKSCYKTGKCIQNDDMETIINEIKNSDFVVIGSPSYWGDVTGQLKTFFDRNTPYGDTNKNRMLIPEGKKGISISIRAGLSEGENNHIIASIEHYFGHLGITPVYKLKAEGINNLEDWDNHAEKLEEAYRIGYELRNLGREGKAKTHVFFLVLSSFMQTNKITNIRTVK